MAKRKRIPYDRVNLGEEETGAEAAGAGPLLGADAGLQGLMPPMAGPPAGGGDLAAMLGGGGGVPPEGDLASMLGGGGGMMPPEAGGMMPPEAGGEVIGPPVPDVAAGDFEQMAIQELTAALQDPSTPPEERAMIEEQLAEAARRRLTAGGGGLAI